LSGCNVADGDYERTYPQYEVLKDDLPLRYSYVNAGLPPATIAFSNEPTRKAYLCVGSYDNAIHPGKTYSNTGGCIIGFAGQTVLTRTYWAMVPDFNGSQARTFITGKYHSEPLYSGATCAYPGHQCRCTQGPWICSLCPDTAPPTGASCASMIGVCTYPGANQCMCGGVPLPVWSCTKS
jgi:hypothetical protein